MRLTSLELIAALIIMILTALFVPTASAQEATPTLIPTTTVPNLCTGAPQQRGGQSYPVGGQPSLPRNRVTLPGGANFAITIAPPPDVGFVVCYVEGNARVFISLSCQEIRRENPTDNESADLLLDVIVDSCEVIATPTPTPAPPTNDATATPTATASGTIITPPDTGNAGLR
jgi:hypothetical protein